MAEKNDKQRKAVKRIKKAVRKAVAKGVPVRDISQTVDIMLSEPAKSKKPERPKKAAKKEESSEEVNGHLSTHKLTAARTTPSAEIKESNG